MQRSLSRRVIFPATDSYYPAHTIDLRWAALSAAIETLQIDLVARGWLGMFAALLDHSSELRWAQDGPGGEAEIKRAYSALFGRFFGRAILRWEHGCVWLRQVTEGLELAPGVRLHRVGIYGDLPDWVGWDSQNGCITICEAKGSRDKGRWHSRLPPVVAKALEQINRIEVRDSAGRIATKNWVVASRWGTELNGLEPTIITFDPRSPGRRLNEEEASLVEAHMCAYWMADMLRGLGRDDLARLVGEGNADAGTREFGIDLTIVEDQPAFAALLIDGGGVFPLVGPLRQQRFAALREASAIAGRKIAVIALRRDAALAAAQRRFEPPFTQADDGILMTERSVEADGLILTWDERRVRFPDD